MRLPRMTTRRWMVVVGGVFLTAAQSVYLQRQLALHQRAAYHEKFERLKAAPSRTAGGQCSWMD